MKASFRHIFAALAATAALVACTKETTPPSFENDKVNPAVEGSRVIAVSFGTQTKTYLDDDGLQPKFNDGDSVLISNGKAIDTCEVSVDGDKATISTILTGALTAVYPYTAAGMNGNTIDTVLVSTVQSGTFADANICMAKMKDENDESLSFDNKTAVFCITPSAGDTTRYVEVITAGTEIANTTSGEYTKKNKIHVATESADSVWVSILVPDGLKVRDLSFADGFKMKTVNTGDDATKDISVNKLYTVSNAGWSEPYVEIDGLKWATRNIGANSFTDKGWYFSWGNTEGYIHDGSKWVMASDSTTMLVLDGKFNATNYNLTSGSGLLTNISPTSEYDAARVNWGGDWRMPSSSEFFKLYNACVGAGGFDNNTKPTGKPSEKGVYLCDNYEGVAGCLFYDGTNLLFFPAVGSGYDDGLIVLSGGGYWSSSLNTSGGAYAFNFNAGITSIYNRYTGQSVRPVSD